MIHERYSEAIRELGKASDQVISRVPSQEMRDKLFAIFQRLAIVLTMLAEDANKPKS